MAIQQSQNEIILKIFSNPLLDIRESFIELEWMEKMIAVIYIIVGVQTSEGCVFS